MKNMLLILALLTMPCSIRAQSATAAQQPPQGGKVKQESHNEGPTLVAPNEVQLKTIELAYRNFNEAQKYLGEVIVQTRAALGLGDNFLFDPSRSAFVRQQPAGSPGPQVVHPDERNKAN